MLYVDSYTFRKSHFSAFLNSEDVIREDLMHKLLYELNPQIIYS